MRVTPDSYSCSPQCQASLACLQLVLQCWTVLVLTPIHTQRSVNMVRKYAIVTTKESNATGTTAVKWVWAVFTQVVTVVNSVITNP